jgi:hypothetical protein
MTRQNHTSPTFKALEDAIDLDLEGRSPYPERASFIDADTPYVEDAIQRAFDDDRAAILVAADGSTQILLPGDAGRRAALS